MQFIQNNTEQTLSYNEWLLTFNMKIATLRKVNVTENEHMRLRCLEAFI